MNNDNMAQPAVSSDGLPMLPINRFRTTDIDEHARNMGGWQVCYDQLTPGRFDGELIEFRSDWMQLVRDRSNQALTKQGMAWEGAITFSVPLSADGPVFCSGHPIVEPSLLVAHGHNLPELRTPQHLDLLGVAIDEQALEHVLERQGSRFRITDLPKCYRLGNSTLPAELAALFDELEGGEQGRDSLLGYESIRRGLRDTVMLHILELVAPDEAPPLSPTARKRMVDRAREYALAHVDEPLSILDLCNHIGASRRKLQYCFQETLGINPVAYLRALRLNAVRRELRNGDQGLGVQEVAARWGFWHLSRFSSDYRTLFGETPSHTLRRTHLC
ncbi:AraC family transcriptional regulator, ethanolamine operon transcriptional activator [Pseudomonas sp. NFACC15-1]|uniref:helix-turn-helix domain-containing protein n=1 Tax=unclassified Pseudomonas TaxID=196821 RepID=UPI0008898ABE|nr:MULTISPECIES: helix-turn-helix domain-containing protein [unclassified Pseudomonas]SDA49485.1 AraC family transcriptional regulator, ethanolamine operon transcriptional activator [Pseudomonas sp. NFACC15-1]SDX29391.1 AraC family transcriptional regulator, ethanolamine operon transcriptional activator [Pseudomonas sp. NFACC14]